MPGLAKTPRGRSLADLQAEKTAVQDRLTKLQVALADSTDKRVRDSIRRSLDILDEIDAEIAILEAEKKSIEDQDSDRQLETEAEVTSTELLENVKELLQQLPATFARRLSQELELIELYRGKRDWQEKLAQYYETEFAKQEGGAAKEEWLFPIARPRSKKNPDNRRSMLAIDIGKVMGLINQFRPKEGAELSKVELRRNAGALLNLRRIVFAVYPSRKMRDADGNITYIPNPSTAKFDEKTTRFLDEIRAVQKNAADHVTQESEASEVVGQRPVTAKNSLSAKPAASSETNQLDEVSVEIEA